MADTVPPQAEATTVLTLITAGLTEVKDAVNALSRDLNGTLARLPTDFVPRREIERRMDELIIDIGAERAARESAISAERTAREAAVKELCADRDKLEAERKNHMRWLIGLALATATSLVGIVNNLVN